jgi:hypothetical protein
MKRGIASVRWYSYVVLAFGFCFDRCGVDDARWSHVYRKRFTLQDVQVMADQTTLFWPREQREQIEPFSQLIFSWNATRPERGYFTFSAQVRDATTKQWGPWHMMMDWGADRQRSYAQKTPLLSSYYHVRLELNHEHFADGFRIRIDAHDGASLTQLKTLFVCASDFTKFRPEGLDAVTSLESVHVSDVPHISQFLVEHEHKDSLCSPTSVTMLARFVTGQKIEVSDVARQVFDDGLKAYGSWPFNTAHLFELISQTGCVATCRLNSFTHLHAHLQRGMPVIVSVRGWLRGAPKIYENGHLLVVVGWDAQKKQIICHDPAAKKIGHVMRHYDITDFLAAWERSRRLAYVLELD